MDPDTQDLFFSTVITNLGLTPTPWRKAFFAEWASYENTGAQFNPLATTQPGGEDPDDPYWNTFGDSSQYHVRNYRTMADGVAATVATLQLDYYTLVRRSLTAEAIFPGTAGQILTWGTTGFADLLDDGWTPPAPPPPRSLSDVWALLDALELPLWLRLDYAPPLAQIQAMQRRETLLTARVDALERALQGER